MPGEINIDNESSKTSTKLTVEVKSSPTLQLMAGMTMALIR